MPKTPRSELRDRVINQAIYMVYLLDEHDEQGELMHDAMLELAVAVYDYRDTLTDGEAHRVVENTVILGEKG